MNDGSLPTLRKEVVLRVQSSPEGAETFLLEEPGLGFRCTLDRGASAMARRLDGKRDRAAVLADLAREGIACRPEQLDDFLGFLSAYGLLDDERARRALAAGAVPGTGSLGFEDALGFYTGARDAAPAPAGKELPLALLPGARFACQASGFCCRSGYSFGPVEDHVRARILEEDWSEIPELRERFAGDASRLFTKAGPFHYLTPIDGRCVFHAPDGKCRVHGRLGYDAKPFICRVFPFAFVEGPDGVRVSIRFECRSLHTARTIGTPLAEREEELRAYVRESRGLLSRLPAIVSLAPGVPVPFPAYERLERALLASLAREGPSPEAHLAALRELAWPVVSALGRHPGEETVEQTLALLDAGKLPPAPAPDRAGTLAAFLDVQDELLGGVAEQFPRVEKNVAAEDWNRVLHGEWMLLLLASARRVADRAGIDYPAPPVENLRALEDVVHDSSDPDVGGLYVEWFRNELFGRYVAHNAGLVPSLGLLAFRYALARFGSKIRAHGRGARRVAAADVMDTLIVVNRLVQVSYLRDSVRKVAPRLVDLFAGLDLAEGPP